MHIAAYVGALKEFVILIVLVGVVGNVRTSLFVVVVVVVVENRLTP